MLSDAQTGKIVLSVDANSAYTLDQIEHVRKFDAFNLLMIEQPLWNDEIYLHARLQKAIRTSICLDESIRHARDADFALESGACRIINIKVGRVGGFSEAKKVHDLAQRHNVPVWCGGMLESGVGRAHNIALSTLENFRLPGDVSRSACGLPKRAALRCRAFLDICSIASGCCCRFWRSMPGCFSRRDFFETPRGNPVHAKRGFCDARHAHHDQRFVLSGDRLSFLQRLSGGKSSRLG